MGLKQNGTLNAQYPRRASGAGFPTLPSMRGVKRNIYFGLDQATSVPVGYRHPGAWLLAQKPGGLGSINIVAGQGSLSASGAMGLNAEAGLTGEAGVSGTGQLVVSAASDVTGSGTISGNILAALVASADLSASGTFEGAATALGWATADLSGVGSVSLTPYATGTLAGDISVSAVQDLTAGSVAEEILDSQLVETGLTVRQTLRLCASALGGKVSGAGTTSIVFRDVGDTKDVISATVDASGNRLSVSVDVS